MPSSCKSECACKDPEAKENETPYKPDIEASGIDDEDDDDDDKGEGSGSDEEGQFRTSTR